MLDAFVNHIVSRFHFYLRTLALQLGCWFFVVVRCWDGTCRAQNWRLCCDIWNMIFDDDFWWWWWWWWWWNTIQMLPFLFSIKEEVSNFEVLNVKVCINRCFCSVDESPTRKQPRWVQYYVEHCRWKPKKLRPRKTWSCGEQQEKYPFVMSYPPWN